MKQKKVCAFIALCVVCLFLSNVRAEELLKPDYPSSEKITRIVNSQLKQVKNILIEAKADIKKGNFAHAVQILEKAEDDYVYVADIYMLLAQLYGVLGKQDMLFNTLEALGLYHGNSDKVFHDFWRGVIDKNTLVSLNVDVDVLWKDLMGLGYIDQDGVILQKFRRLKSKTEFKLNGYDEIARGKIYDFLRDSLGAFYSVIKGIEEKRGEISIAPFWQGKRSAVSVCFDDGDASVYNIALPMFDQYNFHVTIPINSGFVMVEPSLWSPSWEQWKQAVARGHEIANHTLNHIGLPELSNEEMDAQVTQSYDLIEKNLGVAPETFVFPKNLISKTGLMKARERHFIVRYPEELRALYRKTFSPMFGGNRFSFKTAKMITETAIDGNMWLIPVLHAVGEEKIKLKSFKPVTEDFLKSYVDYLKIQEEEVWVDTMRHVFSYVFQRHNSSIEIIQQSEDGFEFIVRNKSNQIIWPYLTLVVRLPEMVERAKVHVYQRKDSKVTEGKLLPFFIKEGNVYVDVQMNNEPVVVRWK